MDHRRAFWLVAWPVVSVLAAVAAGVVSIGAVSLVAESDSEDATGLQLLLDRAALSGDVRLTALTQHPGTLAVVAMTARAWVVALGVGAQRYFPERRRLAVAALTIVSAVGLTVAGIEIGSGWAAEDLITLGQLVPVAAAMSVAAGIVAFPLAGHWWQSAAPRHNREPPVYEHLADLL
jgi:uncharacterized membrane protein YeiB